MKIRIEIDPFTKSGRKAYEFIESLKNKDGITYIKEKEYMSDAEVKDFEKRAIEHFEELQDELFPQESKKNNTSIRHRKILSRNINVAGTKTEDFF
ncbi:MAG: hypothetical protein IKA83_08835 [Paludibacteraceae bacterium]|nr:hypothetical protein [Paludibacteraceae bacterium]MBR6686820.1 hypothetical protein [Paludibacteraceae bacterium]